MTIHAMCVVKNEADVIEQTLRSAAKWADWIYVLDNGSCDGTWERVRTLAQDLPPVVPYRRDSRPFYDGIRNDIFQRYRKRARRGDWWCILDADEFYLDDPPRFLAGVPSRYNAVWYALYVYLFTDKDRSTWERDPQRFDDTVPIEQRLRHYVVGDYSEARFFRHSSTLACLPDNDLRPVYPRRIRLKHFAYRSPNQIQQRLETRREPMGRGEFVHEKRANWVPGGVAGPGPATVDKLPRSWEERVVSSSECHEDRGDGTYAGPGPWSPPTTPRPAGRFLAQARRLVRRVIA